jgi:hypothetical protein
VTATTTRSRVSHVPVMPWSRGSAAARRRPCRRPTAAPAPAARQVARAEVVGERRVDLVGGVDVAVRHAAAQRLGGHVDELDLVGGAHDLVGDGLALRTPVMASTTSLSDSRCWTLTVEMTSMPASSSSSTSCHRFSLRSPGRWCGRARRRGRPRVGGPSTASRSISSSVGAPVLDGAARHDLEVPPSVRRSGPGRGSRRSRRRRRCRARGGDTLAEHGEGLADPGAAPR